MNAIVIRFLRGFVKVEDRPRSMILQSIAVILFGSFFAGLEGPQVMLLALMLDLGIPAPGLLVNPAETLWISGIRLLATATFTTFATFVFYRCSDFVLHGKKQLHFPIYFCRYHFRFLRYILDLININGIYKVCNRFIFFAFYKFQKPEKRVLSLFIGFIVLLLLNSSTTLLIYTSKHNKVFTAATDASQGIGGWVLLCPSKNR